MKIRIFSMILAIVLIFTFSFYLDSVLNDVYESRKALAMDQTNIIDVEKLSNDVKMGNNVDGQVLFLLTGVDKNKGKNIGNVRTDTMMLVNVDMASGNINIISIPRDTRTLIDGSPDKMNHAHSYGGIDLTIETIRDMFNIDLDYYVKVNFEAVEDIVDAIGGIEYKIPEGHTFEEEGFSFKEGETKVFTGEEALAYIRHRKSYSEGDVGRVNTQLDFVKTAISQVLDAKNIVKLPEFVNTYFSKVETNIPFSQVLSMALNANKLSEGQVNTYIIPGIGGYKGGVSYYFIDREEIEDLINRVLSEYILTLEDEESIEKWNDFYDSNYPND